MSEYIKVAVDAMGGDNAPREIVKGAVEAVNESRKVKVCLVGVKEAVEKELSGYTYPREQIEVIHASEVIETAEPPVMAIRKKKDSSLVKALNLVKDGTCNAYVSAGSTGATLVCIRRKLWSNSGRRTSYCRPHQRSGETAACTADSYGYRMFPADRLRG